MSGHDDDLSPWDDDTLVRALRGPGTADELAGEAEFMSAFRAAQPPAPTSIQSGRLRRAGRRLGGGGTAVVLAVTLGAGAAAAYTQNLPDPVQRAVHGVLGPVGVPAPKTSKRVDPPQADPSPDATDPPSTPADPPTGSPTESPTSSTDSPDGETGKSPTGSPSDSPTGSPSQSPTASPSQPPTQSPTEAPSPTPTEASPAPPANLTLGATSHRAGPDERVPLTGTVTAADNTPVVGQEVSLLQKQGASWRPVATAVSDGSGAVSLPAPALLRTSVFRLGVGDSLASESWRIVLVPTISMTSAPGASGTGIQVSVRGGQPGDRVALLSRRPGKDVLVGRSRLSPDLTTTFQVAAPRKRLTFVASLPRSRAHAAARTSVRVQPVKPTTMTAAVPDPILGPDESVTVSGTVSGVGGTVLPGRRVALMMRSGGGGWRQVGSAVSDATGSVSIPLGPIASNASVRLRVGRVRSTPIPLWLQPEWSSAVSSAVSPGATTAVVSGTALGGTTGDTVLLRRLVAGRLTTVARATLDPGGSVRFEVPVPTSGPDRYRLVLAPTPLHLGAIASVDVSPAAR